MIIPLPQDARRLSLRIKSKDHDVVTEWQHLQLCIMPGEYGGRGKCCEVLPSPWYFCGCWPGVRTGVDLNDMGRQHLPPVVCSAFETDDDGRVVFLLPVHAFRTYPPGRYTGFVRYVPCNRTPVFLDVHGIPCSAPKDPRVLPDGYESWPSGKDDEGCLPCPPPPRPRPQVCVLAWFDIDVTPACGEHFIEDAVVDVALNDCGDV